MRVVASSQVTVEYYKYYLWSVTVPYPHVKHTAGI